MRRTESAEIWGDALAAGLDHRLEAFALERQDSGAGERAEQAGRDHAVVPVRQHLHVEGDDALGREVGAFHNHFRIGDGVAWLLLLGDGIEAVRRGDQGRAVRCDQTAQDRAARFHQLGGDHDVDLALGRHQRQDRRVALLRRQHLDVVEGRAGALGDPRHRGRLGVPALGFGKLHDPVGQHAAALAAHGENRNGDRPLGGESRQGPRYVVHLSRFPRQSAKTIRPASRRRCRKPITARRSPEMRRSNQFGLWMMSAR